MRKVLVRFALMVLLMLLPNPAAWAISIEQAQAVMPEIDVYLHDTEGELSGFSAEEIQAQLGDRPLTVDSLAPSEQGIFYFFMFDVSASIPKAHFEAAKQTVLDTYEAMHPQDQLAVITFGSQVELLLNGSESREQVISALEGMTCTDENTKFYDAMSALVEATGNVENMRRIAVVISDGIDDTDAGMTQVELEQMLHRSGVAVYALAIDQTKEAAIQTFRSFIRLSGGELYLFSPGNAADVVSDLLGRIGNIWKLKLTAADNRADGQAHELSIRFGTSELVSTQVRTERWIPDKKPPQVTSMTIEGTDTVVLTFSESMQGLEDASHFLLRNPSGQTVPVTLDCSQTGDQVRLLAEDLTEENGWTLTLSGLTDVSMEKNALEDAELSLSGGLGSASQTTAPSESAEETVHAGKADVMKSIFILSGILLTAVGLGVGALLWTKRARTGSEKKKKQSRKPTPAAGTQHVKFLFQADDEKKGE
ncbi:MAG: VWA domain-containing protein [Lawsonibacter sp.]|nr:VWA domain-containing protein [Lawsonibacter sp.]